MSRAREASSTFSDGLRIDPANAELRDGLQQATLQVLSDLIEGAATRQSFPSAFRALSGRGKETLCLPPPAPCERISDLAYATPLHRIKVDDLLPTKLLTPQQAERDHHIRDTYNYVTIQARLVHRREESNGDIWLASDRHPDA